MIIYLFNIYLASQLTLVVCVIPCVCAADVLTELLFDFALEELHFHSLSVYQQHVSRFCHPNELHDALGICMSTEGHVLHL